MNEEGNSTEKKKGRRISWIRKSLCIVQGSRWIFCVKVEEAHFLIGRKKLPISTSLSHPPHTQIDQKSSAALSRKQGKSTWSIFLIMHTPTTHIHTHSHIEKLSKYFLIQFGCLPTISFFLQKLLCKLERVNI